MFISLSDCGGEWWWLYRVSSGTWQRPALVPTPRWPSRHTGPGPLRRVRVVGLGETACGRGCSQSWSCCCCPPSGARLPHHLSPRGPYCCYTLYYWPDPFCTCNGQFHKHSKQAQVTNGWKIKHQQLSLVPYTAEIITLVQWTLLH